MNESAISNLSVIRRLTYPDFCSLQKFEANTQTFISVSPTITPSLNDSKRNLSVNMWYD